jgi:hypothetical protein
VQSFLDLPAMETSTVTPPKLQTIKTSSVKLVDSSDHCAHVREEEGTATVISGVPIKCPVKTSIKRPTVKTAVKRVRTGGKKVEGAGTEGIPPHKKLKLSQSEGNKSLQNAITSDNTCNEKMNVPKSENNSLSVKTKTHRKHKYGSTKVGTVWREQLAIDLFGEPSSVFISKVPISPKSSPTKCTVPMSPAEGPLSPSLPDAAEITHVPGDANKSIIYPDSASSIAKSTSEPLNVKHCEDVEGVISTPDMQPTTMSQEVNKASSSQGCVKSPCVTTVPDTEAVKNVEPPCSTQAIKENQNVIPNPECANQDAPKISSTKPKVGYQCLYKSYNHKPKPSVVPSHVNEWLKSLPCKVPGVGPSNKEQSHNPSTMIKFPVNQDATNICSAKPKAARESNIQTCSQEPGIVPSRVAEWLKSLPCKVPGVGPSNKESSHNKTTMIKFPVTVNQDATNTFSAQSKAVYQFQIKTCSQEASVVPSRVAEWLSSLPYKVPGVAPSNKEQCDLCKPSTVIEFPNKVYSVYIRDKVYWKESN